jgi:UDPglucose 6-dehydrogenase
MKYILSLLLLASNFCALSITKKPITVIGIGRLGLCLALCLEKSGYSVLGIDVSQEYVKKINDKKLTSPEPRVEEFLKNSRNFRASTSLTEGLNFSDICFIVVPTPSSIHESYDHSILSSVLTEINKQRVKNKHLVICCTVYPGYTDSIGSYLLKDCTNTTLSYNPEFIAQGNIIQGFLNPDIILIGQANKAIGDILTDIYITCCTNTPKIHRMSPASAEITKLAVNCFITTKIAYANMIGDIAQKTKNAHVEDILTAIGQDSRIGAKCLKYGYGFGGPCFPRDNRALGNYAKQNGVKPTIPVATDTCNKEHTQRMAQELLQKNQTEYIFEDVNYKENCPVIILEESQKLAVAQLLAAQGKKIIIKDSPAVINEVKKLYGNKFTYQEK